VAHEVLLRKLSYLKKLLGDLAPLRTLTAEQVLAEHYKLERLLELLVMTASDILFHLLAERGITPSSYRDGFKRAGEVGLLPTDLANRLQAAAAMCNLLVHQYEEIDYTILYESIEPAYQDFSRFVAVFAAKLDQTDDH
jgi:uncharacterized protein YutE (UPF0331/DUF86 family)